MLNIVPCAQIRSPLLFLCFLNQCLPSCHRKVIAILLKLKFEPLFENEGDMDRLVSLWAGKLNPFRRTGSPTRLLKDCCQLDLNTLRYSRFVLQTYTFLYNYHNYRVLWGTCMVVWWPCLWQLCHVISMECIRNLSLRKQVGQVLWLQFWDAFSQQSMSLLCKC